MDAQTHNLEDWVAAYPVWYSTQSKPFVADALQIIRHRGTAQHRNDVVDELLSWAERDGETPEQFILLFLINSAEKDGSNILESAQEAVSRAPEKSAPWLCIGKYIASGAYDNTEALSCFYKGEEHSGTIFEKAYALSWIKLFQEKVESRRYVRQAERKLAELRSTRLSWLPCHETALVDVLYSKEFEIKGL